jgi:NADPH-dependent curcumin reductase CurA
LSRCRGGLTAYFGVTDGLQVKSGDTVVVSAATGATGSLVAGICKALGAQRVIGTAGGPEKCEWIIDKAGYDAAIDYRNEDLAARLNQLCPNGVDAYFDNVGGDMLDTLLLHMAPFGRILICGAMSSGYTDVRLQGPTNYMRICTQMLTMRGILLTFYDAERLQQGAAQLGQWVLEGKLHVEEHVVDGFENAPHTCCRRCSPGRNPASWCSKLPTHSNVGAAGGVLLRCAHISEFAGAAHGSLLA